MRKTISIVSLALVLTTFVSWKPAEKTELKCLVQMANYDGEKAYLVISLINPEGAYEETLYVMGDDEEWYPDLVQWWSFYEEDRIDIDGITGASISGGFRSVCVVSIDESKIDAGYKIRFETSVEDQKYFENDVEMELKSEQLPGKFEGQGYIRYVRMMAK